MRAHLDSLMQPSSIAILGDSPGSGRGGALHQQLVDRGYRGEIFPVNPKYSEIRGLPSYESISAIPTDVHFAVIALGAQHTRKMFHECVSKGVKAALLLASGFAEVGAAGREAQEEIAHIARENGIAICGPNCYGIANLVDDFVAYGGPLPDTLKSGSVGLVFQSGALTHSVLDPAVMRDIGFSYVVTTGNEAVTELADYVDFVGNDPRTSLVACFVESFRDPARFLSSAGRIVASGKPVVVLKVGRSARSKTAALAHTGALVGPDEGFDAAFRKFGIIRVNDMDELLEAVELLRHGPVGAGDAALMSISGGGSGIMADLAEDVGLGLASFPERTAAKLRRALPSFAGVNNPLDLTGAVSENPAILDEVSHLLLHEESALSTVALGLNSSHGEDSLSRRLNYRMSEAAIAKAEGTRRRLILFSMTSGKADPEVLERAHSSGISFLQGMRETLAVVASCQRAAEGLANAKTAVYQPANSAPLGLLELLEPSNHTVLTEGAALRAVSTAGIEIPREHLARDAEEATEFAKDIGLPVALKLDSPDIVHRAQSGCMRLDLGSLDAVADGFHDIVANARRVNSDARLNGVLVQEMAPDGVDVFVGAKRYPGLDPIVLLGQGGTQIEARKNVAARMVPLGRAHVLQMLVESGVHAELELQSDIDARDIEALIDSVLKLNTLVQWLDKRITEVDVNPLRVCGDGKGVVALDALLLLA